MGYVKLTISLYHKGNDHKIIIELNEYENEWKIEHDGKNAEYVSINFNNPKPIARGVAQGIAQGGRRKIVTKTQNKKTLVECWVAGVFIHVFKELAQRRISFK